MQSEHKSGFVAIIGAPNVGKSTLLNALVGQKIAIISDKPQTTRDKILAVYTDSESQIIFTDTPGIHTPKNKLGEIMVKSAKETIKDVDVIVLMQDITKEPKEAQQKIADILKKSSVPAILVLNKIDLVKKDIILERIDKYAKMYDFDAVIPMSAKNDDGVNILIKEIKSFLSDGPLYYDEDTVTDKSVKHIAAEIIREKMLWLLDKEVPHGIAIEIEKMKQKNDITTINAVIYCEKDSHKGIIIGKNGEMLKKIGTLSRKDIEIMVEGKVYLELWVRVKKDWRNSNFLLRNFGFVNKEE